MSTMKFAVVCVMMLGQLATAQYENEPDEIAPYEVIRIADGYEERVYPPAKWVCHNSTGKPFSSRMQRRSFFALFRYITGSNDLEEEIPMTAPVTMLTKFNSKIVSLSRMCFYLPAEHQASPPSPTNAEVYIENRPRITVLTRTFGGFAMRKSIWENEAEELKEILQETGETNVDFSHFYSAGYDSPMKFENRRNEVWFLKN